VDDEPTEDSELSLGPGPTESPGDVNEDAELRGVSLAAPQADPIVMATMDHVRQELSSARESLESMSTLLNNPPQPALLQEHKIFTPSSTNDFFNNVISSMTEDIQDHTSGESRAQEPA
jgi:hypothetical protein